MTHKERPKFLNLFQIKVPITAYISFAHRVSGVLMVFFLGFLLYVFSLSLQSEEGFNQAKAYFDLWYFKFFIWLTTTTLIYHLVAGIRHLVMDMGIGENLKSAKISSYITILFSVLGSFAVFNRIFLS